MPYAILQSSYSALFALPWDSAFLVTRVLFILGNVLLIAGIVFVWRKAGEFKNRYPHRTQKVRADVLVDPQIKVRWEKIVEEAAAHPPHSYTVGIIAGDKFVDEVLKRMGMVGEHMADRLESLGSSGRITPGTLSKVFRAHGIRNQLVHEPDYEISKRATEEVLSAYRNFLKELNLL